jgi:hypothetical protein
VSLQTPRPESKATDRSPPDQSIGSIQNDPIVRRILEQLPRQSRDSFTDEQLLAMKTAFGARRWFKHPLDLRGSVKLWRWRFYYVILAGSEKRSLTPRERRLARLSNLAVAAGLAGLTLVTGLIGLYLLKSALGIDLMPGFSLGVWSWFQEAFL